MPNFEHFFGMASLGQMDTDDLLTAARFGLARSLSFNWYLTPRCGA